MSRNIIGDALPILGETDKASSSNLTKSADRIVAKKYDKFDLKTRMGKNATSKHKITLFQVNEKKALREKYLSSFDLSEKDIAKLEAMFNGMYNLAKRHSFDIKEMV
jgi:hypothetical protein